MLFRSGKTLAATIGISYVLSMIMQVILLANGGLLFLNPENVDIATVGTLTHRMFLFSNIFHTILTVGLFVGIFFKLKTQKY